jgi:hypothetical protein
MVDTTLPATETQAVEVVTEVTETPVAQAAAPVEEAPASAETLVVEAVQPEVAEDDVDVAEAKLAKAISEIKSLRDRKNTLTADLEAAKAEVAAAQAKVVEAAEAQAKAEALEGALREARVEVAISKAAPALRIADSALDAALRLMDRTKLTFDESGAPTNVAEVLEATIAEFPVLSATPRTAVATGSVTVTNRTGSLTEETLAGLKGKDLLDALSKRSVAFRR